MSINLITPKEKAMKRELNHMELQYQVLNKKMAQAQKVLSEVENRDNNIYRVYFEANPIPEEQRKAGFGGGFGGGGFGGGGAGGSW